MNEKQDDKKVVSFSFGQIEEIDFRNLLPAGETYDVYSTCACGCCSSCSYCDSCGSPAPSDC